MSIEQLVEEMKTKDSFARAFEPTGTKGSGLDQDTVDKGDTDSGKLTPEQAGELSVEEFEAAVKEGKI
jgi:hypothetical protein